MKEGSYSSKELKEMARQRGVSDQGTKQAIIRRLKLPSAGGSLPQTSPGRKIEIPKPDRPVLAMWSARAIGTGGQVDILHDRQNWGSAGYLPNTPFGEDRDRKTLASWLNNEAIPKLGQWWELWYHDQDSVFSLLDGDFYLRAAPQHSYGYLYIYAYYFGKGGASILPQTKKLASLQKEAEELQRKIAAKYPREPIFNEWPEELKKWQNRLWELGQEIARESGGKILPSTVEDQMWDKLKLGGGTSQLRIIDARGKPLSEITRIVALYPAGLYNEHGVSYMHRKTTPKDIAEMKRNAEIRGAETMLIQEHGIAFYVPIHKSLPQKTRAKKPSRNEVEIGSWAERDRMGIWVKDKASDVTIAEWWDKDASQMFEDGFFKPGTIRQQTITGRDFEDSVLDYAESMGLIAPSGRRLPNILPAISPLPRQYNNLTGFINEPLPKSAD